MKNTYILFIYVAMSLCFHPGTARSAEKTAIKKQHGVTIKVKSSKKKSASRDRYNNIHGASDKDYVRYQTLDIKLRNMMRHEENFTLEWYFIAKKLNVKQSWISDRGKEKIFLPALGTLETEKESEPLDSRVVKGIYVSNHKSGSKPEGYLVIVRDGTDIVTVEASPKYLEKYAKPEKLENMLKRSKKISANP